MNFLVLLILFEGSDEIPPVDCQTAKLSKNPNNVSNIILLWVSWFSAGHVCYLYDISNSPLNRCWYLVCGKLDSPSIHCLISSSLIAIISSRCIVLPSPCSISFLSIHSSHWIFQICHTSLDSHSSADFLLLATRKCCSMTFFHFTLINPSK